jgi:hypothetical protein
VVVACFKIMKQNLSGFENDRLKTQVNLLSDRDVNLRILGYAKT